MKIKKIEAQPQEVKKLRVAAYCRVSTDNDDQKESLEAQKAHYETWIKRHSNWDFAGIFYDFGITGTKADVRDGLQALMYECRIGRIDYVLTKSVSRFSRNTTDCLSLVRELLSYNIPVYFEKDNLDTGSMESELILSAEWRRMNRSPFPRTLNGRCRSASKPESINSVIRHTGTDAMKTA